MVVRVVVRKATLALDRQVEILVPGTARCNRPAGRRDAQCKAVRIADRQPVSRYGNLRHKSVRRAFAVVIAAVGEEGNAEQWRRGVDRTIEPPGDIGGIGTGFHPDPMLDDAAAAVKAPDRD